ncbi:MAG: PKD domain-containing protein [Planctomycetota bacterium]
MQRIHVLAGLLLAAGLCAQSPVPLPPFGNTFTGAATRGFWFTCPVPCIVQGIAVPNETSQPFQTVEFLDLGTTPPPNYSATTTGTQLFYDNTTAGGSIIPTNIVLQAGEVYGVLGCCNNIQGGGSGYNSYGTPAGPFTSNILGNPVTLTRFGTQFNIAAGGNNPVWQEPAGQISRVELYIVPAQGLYANFNASPTAGPVGMTVNFTDASFTSDPGGILTWNWDLDGDGITDSTIQNPSFTYNTCGSYDVTLTVTDASNPSSTVTRTGYIEVGITPIAPSFTFAPLAPGVFQFTDTSNPVPSQWAWDLDGDGITDSTLQNPVWAYASPCTSVNVSLQVWSNCAGPWSTSRAIVIAPNAFTTLLTGGNGLSAAGSGNTFDINVHNPNGVTICGLSMCPYMATPVIGTPLGCTIWVTDAAGGYLANHTNATVWRQVATGTGSFAGGTFSAPIPVPMALSNPIFLPSGTYGMAVHMTTGSGVAYTTLTAQTTYPGPDFDIIAGNGKGAPFNATANNPRAFNGTFHYSVRGSGDLAGYGFFGAGCAGSLGISSLVASAPPAIGSTLNVTVNNLPVNVAIMLTGFSKTAWLLGALPFDLATYGAPGCKLRVSPDANLLILGAGGSAVWPFTIPNNAGLIGVNLYNQAVVLSPGTNAAGAVGSDAAGMMVGL